MKKITLYNSLKMFIYTNKCISFFFFFGKIFSSLSFAFLSQFKFNYIEITPLLYYLFIVHFILFFKLNTYIRLACLTVATPACKPSPRWGQDKHWLTELDSTEDCKITSALQKEREKKWNLRKKLSIRTPVY